MVVLGPAPKVADGTTLCPERVDELPVDHAAGRHHGRSVSCQQQVGRNEPAQDPATGRERSVDVDAQERAFADGDVLATRQIRDQIQKSGSWPTSIGRSRPRSARIALKS